MVSRIKWCLLGIPDHQGVIHVGGRLGAAGGPEAFRKALHRLRDSEVRASWVDLGDVHPLTAKVERNHQQAASQIQAAQASTGHTLVIGGGHDHGYSQLLGVHRALSASPKKSRRGAPRLGCINIDAHLDVRRPAPDITSGSPFYLAVEAGILNPRYFVEFGIQPHCNAEELWTYVKKKKISVVPYDKLRNGKGPSVFRQVLSKLAKQCDAVVISLDLDAAAEAFAPGVSSPVSEGFSSSEMIEMASLAGKEKKVVSLGVFELNPQHDIDQRTSRLAATAVWHFIRSSLSR